MKRPRRKKEKVLAPVHPNIGIEVAFRNKLDRLIKDMHTSVRYHVLASYRANQPKMAMDDILPVNALQRAIAVLTKRWLKNFDTAADELAAYFSKAIYKRTDKQLATILKKGGFSVEFKMSQGMRDVVNATTAQNVGLIKSIPQQYLGEVEGMVMRSVQVGRDLGGLAKDLEKRFKITKHRAALISRDQNNKATAAMHRVRQKELGITKAKWKHSHAGKKPRPTHIANDGKTFDVDKGWYDPAVKRFIQPGELINCRCVAKSIVPGFS